MSDQVTAPVVAPVTTTPSATALPTNTNAPTQTTPTPAAAPELFEVKIEGKVVKMTRDEMVQAASLGSAAQKRFNEAAAMKKQAEGMLGRMRDPKQAIALLQDPALGLDQNEVRTAFEDWYSSTYIKREQMTPAERKLADAEARLKQFEDEKRDSQEKQRKQQDDELDHKTRTELQNEIIDVINTSGLPKTRFTGSRVAYWMRVNHENKLNAPKELIVAQVRKEARDIMDSMVQSADGDVLENLLGESTTKKLRKISLERLRQKRSTLGGVQPAPAPKKESGSEPREKLRGSDVNRRLRDLRLGRLK